MSVPARVTSIFKTLWWVVLLRGILMALFGIVMIAWPTTAGLAFVWVFGIFALLDGITAFVSVARTKTNVGFGILVGIVSVAAGIIAIVWPAKTALVLLYLIAAWAVVLGIVEIAAGIGARKQVGTSWVWIAISGALTVALGIVLFLNPGSGILALLIVVGVFTLLAGLAMVIGAFFLRSLATKVVAEVRSARAQE